MNSSKSKGRVFIRTFGCQMNKHDSGLFGSLLARDGWEITSDEKEASVIILNTCGVRRRAEERVWGKLAEYENRRSSGEAFVVGVVGCMAQLHGRGIWERFPGVDFIAGPGSFAAMPRIVESCRSRRGRRIDTGFDPAEDFYRSPFRSGPFFQSYVTISRGCENYCSYCVVPFARGREDCRPAESILAEVRGLAGKGCREVTLLGQNVNSYRFRDRAGRETDFAALLEAVDAVEGIKRIRFLTSHPKDISVGLIEAIARLPKVCEYLHFPAQSGSDRILEKMNRGYDRGNYLRKVEMLKKAVPGIALSSDFIAGFPGETGEDFERTLELMREVEFDQSFLFKYSPRPRTASARLSDDVPDEVKRDRHRRLLEEQERLSLKKNLSLVDREVEVLVEGESKSNPAMAQGRTRSNKLVIFPRFPDGRGELVKLRITRATARALYV